MKMAELFGPAPWIRNLAKKTDYNDSKEATANRSRSSRYCCSAASANRRAVGGSSSNVRMSKSFNRNAPQETPNYTASCCNWSFIKGYDSIALAPHGFAKFKAAGKLPRWVELNVLSVVKARRNSQMQ